MAVSDGSATIDLLKFLDNKMHRFFQICSYWKDFPKLHFNEEKVAVYSNTDHCRCSSNWLADSWIVIKSNCEASEDSDHTFKAKNGM